MSVGERDAVLAALPRKGLLRTALEVQAFAPRRMSKATVEAALRQLWDEGRVIHREPFDVGRPDRWGRA